MNKYMSASEISSSSTFVILSIASQLKDTQKAFEDFENKHEKMYEVMFFDM